MRGNGVGLSWPPGKLRPVDTYHSVVAVGYDATHVYVDDPHFDNAPIQVTKDDFWLAWLEMSNRYAIISLQ
jgi:uncharacterized protein YvpB